MTRLLGLLLILTALCAAEAAGAHAAIPTCRAIVSMITPCLSFLSDRAVDPSRRCCSAVTALNRTAHSHQDRVGVCSCFKSIYPRFPMIDFGRAAALPRMCGVGLNITISPSTNCRRVPQLS